MNLLKCFFIPLIFISFNLFASNIDGKNYDNLTEEEKQIFFESLTEKERNNLLRQDYGKYIEQEIVIMLKAKNQKKELIKSQIPNFISDPNETLKVLIGEDDDNECQKDGTLRLSLYLICIYDNEEVGKYTALGDDENKKWTIMQNAGKSQSFLTLNDITIFVDGIAGLDGQSMKGKYYILEYTGIKQYTNVLGNNRSIPSFKVIKQISL